MRQNKGCKPRVMLWKQTYMYTRRRKGTCARPKRMGCLSIWHCAIIDFWNWDYNHGRVISFSTTGRRLKHFQLFFSSEKLRFILRLTVTRGRFQRSVLNFAFCIRMACFWFLLPQHCSVESKWKTKTKNPGSTVKKDQFLWELKIFQNNDLFTF